MQALPSSHFAVPLLVVLESIGALYYVFDIVRYCLGVHVFPSGARTSIANSSGTLLWAPLLHLSWMGDEGRRPWPFHLGLAKATTLPFKGRALCRPGRGAGGETELAGHAPRMRGMRSALIQW